MTKHEITKDQLINLAQERIDSSIYFYTTTYELKTNDWEKYGKKRTYIDIVHYTGMGRLSEKHRCGYIDNLTGEYVVNRREYDIVEDMFE